MPYIMGFHHADIDEEYFKQGQRCFVDIDTGTVTCPEDVPEFPDRAQFAEEINEILANFAGSRKTSLKSRLSSKPSDSTSVNSVVTLTNNNNTESKMDRHGHLVDNKYSVESLFEHNMDNDEDDEDDEYAVDASDEDSDRDEYIFSDSIGDNNSPNETSSILRNSQAFVRISELARKTGALNFNDYSVSSSSGISLEHSNSNSSCSSNRNRVLRKQSQANSTTNQDEKFLVKVQFAHTIRELFLQRFIHMFASYEKFVMLPTMKTSFSFNDESGDVEATNKIKTIDDWWANREYMDNFDSKMFLIEQPSPYLPFLSHFVYTQMFVSFIDLKIMSFYQASDVHVQVISCSNQIPIAF